VRCIPTTYIDVQKVARETIKRIGIHQSDYQFEYNSCGVMTIIHEQSQDINRGVEREDPMEQGAGDQGMMFGYATIETDDYMPLPLELSHRCSSSWLPYSQGRKGDDLPAARFQIPGDHRICDDDTPFGCIPLCISTQHDEFDKTMTACLVRSKDVQRDPDPQGGRAASQNAFSSLFDTDLHPPCESHRQICDRRSPWRYRAHRRKIIVDTYGGKGAHGGGAFSGKILPRWTALLPMQPGTSPKTWWQPASPMKYWCSFPTPSE
jgi:S-adenosylmethionine synthetase